MASFLLALEIVGKDHKMKQIPSKVLWVNKIISEQFQCPMPFYFYLNVFSINYTVVLWCLYWWGMTARLDVSISWRVPALDNNTERGCWLRPRGCDVAREDIQSSGPAASLHQVCCSAHTSHHNSEHFSEILFFFL